MSFTPDPLLNGSSRSNTPRYLRTQWDERTAREFGPWRIAERHEPAAPQMEPALALPMEDSEATAALPDLAPPPAMSADIVETVQARLSEDALNALREEAYARGLQAGREEALQAQAHEQQHQRELLRNLGIELRSLQQDPQRLFEPLKRLAVHVAEQLVRGELQVSGHVIQRLIQRCVEEIEHPDEQVIVTLHPDDLQRLQALGEGAVAHMKLESDAQLTLGSVRVRVNDTLVEDLMVHRLEPLVRRLLNQPDAWLHQSSLLRETVAVADAETPRRWSRQTVDVQDTEARPMQAEHGISEHPDAHLTAWSDAPVVDAPLPDPERPDDHPPGTDGANDGPRDGAHDGI